MDKKGLSGVITLLILISLVIVAAAVVWGVVNGLVKDKLDEAAACSPELAGQIQINGQGTCYDKVSAKMHLSISVGDVDIDEILVSVTMDGETGSGKIEQVANSGLIHEIFLPEIVPRANMENKPEKITIAPVVNGNQCNVVDSISGNEITFCE